MFLTKKLKLSIQECTIASTTSRPGAHEQEKEEDQKGEDPREVGAPRPAGRVCVQDEGGPQGHQRAVVQQLHTQDGHQPRAHHRRSDRGQEAALRHLGKHRERCQQDGEHWEGWFHPGSFPIIYQLDSRQLLTSAVTILLYYLLVELSFFS